jgi:hypothetical protein
VEVVAIIFSPGVNEAISHTQKHLAANISVAKKFSFFLCLKHHVLDKFNKMKK